MSQTASESLPPLTATSTRSSKLSMSWSAIAFSTWRRQSCKRCSPQKLALWRGRSMIAGSRHTLHFEPLATTSSSRDHGPDLDHVGIVQARVARRERAVADHEIRLAVHAEAVEQLIDGALAG